MKDRVILERTGIVAASCGLVFSAHVELEAPVPFGLFLLIVTSVTVVLAGRTGGPRWPVPTRVRRVASPGAGRTTARDAADDGRVARANESAGLEAMRAALRGLEGELHALEDQRLTDLAGASGSLERGGR